MTLYTPSAHLTREEWQAVTHLLLTRSGGLCEARTPDCLTPTGDLSRLPRDRVSIHHRVPRGRGGTRDPRTNNLSRLLIVCGTGVTGCHGWIETHREQAITNGWLIPTGGKDHALIDSEAIPILRAGRTLVRLTDDAPLYT